MHHSPIAYQRSMLTGNAEDLDVVMPMSNVIEQRRNYRTTTGSIRNYYRDEPGDPRTDTQSLKYKTNITGSTPGNDDKKSIIITIPLKSLSNFWRTLNIPLTVR